MVLCKARVIFKEGRNLFESSICYYFFVLGFDFFFRG